MAVAAPLVLRPGDGTRLRALTRSSVAAAGHVSRARMVLLAAEGLPNAEIGRRVGVTRQTVISWRARYEAGGMDALADLPRSGRPSVIDEAAVVTATLNPPPAELAVTHWSARLLAEQLTKDGMPVSFAEVARIWRDWDLQPHRVESFKFSTDPQLELKIRDVVGLYLAPPEKAVVVCVDEKSQIQALDRTAPLLPMRFGVAERRTHEYVRHGTTTLFAALEVATGRITADACHERHRSDEFLAFLKIVAKAHPRVPLHVVVDNYATHSHPRVKAWMAKHPRIRLHFTPTGCSWLNLVEIFFGIITRQAIRRGTFTSVPDLIGAIRAFIDAYNERCVPFAWTKTADQIIAKADRRKGRPRP
ncbi:IS630 family transposase [Micromonospora zamorensis]|uniref:IS630 family transposase n=1 Tax=Micromonospora zamorensis TaxID=709883 RepID=UPI0008201FF9|nr:IS630 family transposase [Micromonospora zamorensis]SCG37576.1 Winged helix-turn helix [Micromonospora zamorensis]